MNLSALKRMGAKALRFISKNKSTILIGIGLSGMWGAVGEAAKAAPVAKERIEARKKELNVDKLTVGETIKTAGPVYLPTIATAVVSTGCIIGGTVSSLSENAALAAACTMTENKLSEYKQSAIETVGEKKEHLINENIAKKKVEELPSANHTELAPGDVRCIDTFTGMEFASNYNKILATISDVNYDVATSDTYVSLNEVQQALGMRSTLGGDMLGWNVCDGKLEVQINTELSQDNEPCLAITITPYPHNDFWHI